MNLEKVTVSPEVVILPILNNCCKMDGLPQISSESSQ